LIKYFIDVSRCYVLMLIDSFSGVKEGVTTVNAVCKVIEDTIKCDFAINVGNFLDDFYREVDKREEMLQEMPIIHESVNRRYYAFVAAMAHKLANDFNLKVPSWVNDDFFYLPEPYFGMNAKGKLRLILMYESPAEFKHRNIFVSQNVLSRC
jgi:hypothetical protein